MFTVPGELSWCCGSAVCRASSFSSMLPAQLQTLPKGDPITGCCKLVLTWRCCLQGMQGLYRSEAVTRT